MIRSQVSQDDAMPTFPASDAAAGSPVPREPRSARARNRQGRREELRKRFAEGGAEVMPDEELLELILFRALPRKEVRGLARRLIEHLGDFNQIISAPKVRLERVPGAGPAVVRELKIVEATAHRLARARITNRPVLSSWDALLDYCKALLAYRETEQFRVLFLDRRNALIADEAQARGTVDHVPVYPREVVKRALELNASALILVHNHPSGDPTPSSSDIAMTAAIQKAAEALGLTLHDHLVIGRGAEFSFRSAGLLAS